MHIYKFTYTHITYFVCYIINLSTYDRLSMMLTYISSAFNSHHNRNINKATIDKLATKKFILQNELNI